MGECRIFKSLAPWAYNLININYCIRRGREREEGRMAKGDGHDRREGTDKMEV